LAVSSFLVKVKCYSLNSSSSLVLKFSFVSFVPVLATVCSGGLLWQLQINVSNG